MRLTWTSAVLSLITSAWPLSRNGAGTYAKASSFLDNLTAPDRIGGGVVRAPRVD